MHAFYDDLAGSGYGVAPVEAAAKSMKAPTPKLAAVRDETVWIKEGWTWPRAASMRRRLAWAMGRSPVDAAYQKAALDLGRKRIALAGARLANLINDALGK